MNGLIIYNAGFYPEAVKNQVEGLTRSFNALGVGVSSASSDSFPVCVSGSSLRSSVGERDFIVFLNKDFAMSESLEKCGYKLFNSSKTIFYCDDKALTYVRLSGAGIPLIDTVFAPVRYYGADRDGFLKDVEKKNGYPIVAKLARGSLGESVVRVDDYASLRAAADSFGCAPHLYQKFYGTGGEDVRMIVVGGRCVAAMKRVNEKDFRSNVELGGEGFPYVPTEEERGIAERCAKVLDADYLGVDVIKGPDGPKVTEVNSNAFFRKVSEVSGTDVAAVYAEFIFEQISGICV